MRIQNQNGTWSKTHYSEQDVNISRGAIPEFVLLWHSFCPLRIYRLYRPWRTTTRKCCLSTGTLDLLAWSLRILSSPSATSPPISPHTRSNWAGTARTWPHTSTCCLRPPGSSGSRHSTCHASLLCWVRSSTNSHTSGFTHKYGKSNMYHTFFWRSVTETHSPTCDLYFWLPSSSVVLVHWHNKHLRMFLSCRKSYSAWWGPGCLPLESAGTRTPTSFSQGMFLSPLKQQPYLGKNTSCHVIQ